MLNQCAKRLLFFLCLFLSGSLIFIGTGSFTSDQFDPFFLLIGNKNYRGLLERNASGSWPNYKLIWDEYYGEIPDFYNCKEYAEGNAKSLSHYAFLGRVPLIKEPELRMECDHIRRRVMGNTVYKRVKHPYAVARNVYADYFLQEMLLAFSYSPFNLYCYAIDKKSQKSFKAKLKHLGNCIPNVVILQKEFNFDSGGHFQDEAHYDCTKELIQFRSWDYVMFLQNADILMKAPEEISDIIGALNGSSLIEFSEPFNSRLPKTAWTPKALDLFQNPKEITNEQLERPIKPRKSPNHMFLPREFIEAMQKKLNIKKVLSLFGGKKYGVDEMLFATLLGASFLELPGQVENTCTVRSIFRFVQWNFRNPEKCQSRKKRHGVCLIGMEYIPLLRDKPTIIANKIWPEWDFGAIMCMGEILYNRTNYPTNKKLNLKPYLQIPQVRERILKSQGKFNVSTFKC